MLRDAHLCCGGCTLRALDSQWLCKEHNGCGPRLPGCITPIAGSRLRTPRARRLAVHAASFASIVTCPHESHPASVLRPAGGSRFSAFAAAAPDSPASVTLTARSRLRTPVYVALLFTLPPLHLVTRLHESHPASVLRPPLLAR